jgi:hypothetical protein
MKLINLKKNTKRNKEVISLNKKDQYTTVGENLDFANGCVIIADVVADVAIDVGTDVIADVVADAVADTIADAAADATADIAADVAGDAAGDVAADAVIDAAVNGGVSTVSSSVLKNLGLVLGGALLDKIVTFALGAIEKAISKSGDPKTTTSADYWNALHETMVKAIPCDVSADNSCGKNQRNGQQAMILSFQANIAKGSPDSATAAIAFEKIWSTKDQHDLKNALTNVSETAGIPSMIKYMASYTSNAAHGAPLVIATANTLIAVTNYVYTD